MGRISTTLIRKLNKTDRKSNRKSLEIALDKVCSQIVHKRDKYCQKCGSTSNLNCHHLWGRVNKSVRWDLDNLILLCFTHHDFFAHADPMGFATWIREKKGQQFVDHLELKARTTVKRTEFDLECLLNERKKQLEMLNGTERNGMEERA